MTLLLDSDPVGEGPDADGPAYDRGPMSGFHWATRRGDQHDGCVGRRPQPVQVVAKKSLGDVNEFNFDDI